MSNYHASKDIKNEEKRLSLMSTIANEDARGPLEEIKQAHPNIKTILDAGCGTGDAFSILKEIFPGSILTAFDQSEKALAVAKNKKLADEFIIADLNDMSVLEDKKFDLIHIRNTLLHVAYPTNVIKGLVSLLSPEGVLFIQEPDWAKAEANWPEFENFKRFMVSKMQNFGINPFMGGKIQMCEQRLGLENCKTKVSTSKITPEDETWDILYSLIEVVGGNDELKEKIENAKQNPENYFITPAWVITWGEK